MRIRLHYHNGQRAFSSAGKYAGFRNIHPSSVKDILSKLRLGRRILLTPLQKNLQFLPHMFRDTLSSRTIRLPLHPNLRETSDCLGVFVSYHSHDPFPTHGSFPFPPQNGKICLPVAVNEEEWSRETHLDLLAPLLKNPNLIHQTTLPQLHNSKSNIQHPRIMRLCKEIAIRRTHETDEV